MPHEFQTLFGPIPNGIFDVDMTEITSAQIQETGLAPSTVLHVGLAFRIHVVWNVSGQAWAWINGQWDLHAYLELMGPGPELMLTDPNDHVIPFRFDGLPYDRWIDVGQNVVNDAGAYKLVVTLTYINNAGQPDQMAGYWEGPILQFYP